MGRVLITGITGFVGSYLAKRLLDLGYDVYGLFRRKADGDKPKILVETGILASMYEYHLTFNLTRPLRALAIVGGSQA
jgi:GDP-D-mannose dehydratase